MPLFDADRCAVWRVVDGHVSPTRARTCRCEYIDEVRQLTEPPTGDARRDGRQGHGDPDVANDPRAGRIGSAIAREGFQTLALAPLMADNEAIGVLAVYHDGPYAWSQQDLDLLEALGTQAGIALRNAKNYQLMATWAAQLQSIQQLGTRLNRWGTVNAIGQAIAAELRQLIDYHNVRVYRVYDQVVEPVAWRGEIGEYTDEEREQLRLKVGEGITGWVAQNGIPQYLPDAAHDPRSQTIPGTEADLDESMLIAPMLYEDHVLGVIVLSKLGLNQFTGDDLRYLEIYASIAAQAMVNADATEQLKAQSDRLARQLSSQRELMQVTESILSTLDPRTVVEEIADRLGGLLKVDNIAIGINDTEAGVVRTLFARGVNADMYMDVVIKDTEGVAGWVLQHGEALLIPRTQDDPRFITFADRVLPGAVMVAPLRSRDKVTGTLLLERLGEDAHFEEEEFELLQLFAGHVSIALQNAEAHHAVEIRAQTDALTGLKNQGTFQEYLQMTVKRGNPFSLLIVDLDDFKSFNDRRGHEAGNVMLAKIAKALRTSCRDSDEVFRYGGDEFALILPNTDEAGRHARRGQGGPRRAQRAGSGHAPVWCHVLHRRGGVPGRRLGPRVDPAGRGPCLLRREAQRPQPCRHLSRGAGPGRRCPARRSDAGRRTGAAARRCLAIGIAGGVGRSRRNRPATASSGADCGRPRRPTSGPVEHASAVLAPAAWLGLRLGSGSGAGFGSAGPARGRGSGCGALAPGSGSGQANSSARRRRGWGWPARPQLAGASGSAGAAAAIGWPAPATTEAARGAGRG